MGAEHQTGVERRSRCGAEPDHQGPLAHTGVGLGVRKAVDQQQRGDHERPARGCAGRDEEKPLALHVVGADDDQKPHQGHRRLAQAARHQPQRRRRIGPGQQQARQAQHDHPAPGPDRQQQARRQQEQQQGLHQIGGLALADQAVLDQARAPGERKDTAGIGRVSAVAGVVQVVEHIAQRVREHGQQRGAQSDRHIQPAAAGRRGGRAEHAGHHGEQQKSRSRHAPQQGRAGRGPGRWGVHGGPVCRRSRPRTLSSRKPAGRGDNAGPIG